jgi:hypothetical protein
MQFSQNAFRQAGQFALAKIKKKNTQNFTSVFTKSAIGLYPGTAKFYPKCYLSKLNFRTNVPSTPTLIKFIDENFAGISDFLTGRTYTTYLDQY